MSGIRRALAWLGVVEDDDEEMEGTISGGFDRDVVETERRIRPEGVAGSGQPRVQVLSGSEEHGERIEREDRTQPVLRPFNPQPERPKIHLTMPTKFADVQEIGDRMKADQPVILNLEGVDKELRRRIIDFTAGLAYALGGKLKEISSSVYLLSPARIEVADEDMFRMRQRTVQRGTGLQHGS
jgi:cell division inhibitor SepF